MHAMGQNQYIMQNVTPQIATDKHYLDFIHYYGVTLTNYTEKNEKDNFKFNFSSMKKL